MVWKSRWSNIIKIKRNEYRIVNKRLDIEKIKEFSVKFDRTPINESFFIIYNEKDIIDKIKLAKPGLYNLI
jgi:hypothetical protein